MSANATGTATSLGIPKFNPAQDIAGPLGVNEMMDSLDSKIAARMFAPAAPADKQVVKWSQSGGAWVAGYVNPSELGQEGATNGQALVWNTAGGKWVPGQAGPGSPATSLPASPTDAQQALLVDSTSAPTYCWLFEYSGAASKWLFIGGAPWMNRVATTESTASTSAVDLTTVQSFSVPRTGTYQVEAGFDAPLTSGGGSNYASVTVSSPSVTTVVVQHLGNQFNSHSGALSVTANASATIKLQFSVNAGAAGSFENRFIKIIPVTVT